MTTPVPAPPVVRLVSGPVAPERASAIRIATAYLAKVPRPGMATAAIGHVRANLPLCARLGAVGGRRRGRAVARRAAGATGGIARGSRRKCDPPGRTRPRGRRDAVIAPRKVSETRIPSIRARIFQGETVRR